MNSNLQMNRCNSQWFWLVFVIMMCRPAGGFQVGERHALLIGVSHYQSDKLAMLPGAEPDARVLAQVLSSHGFKPDHVRVMTNSEGTLDPRQLPTAAKIRKQLKQLAHIESSSDLLIVALAGHGVRVEGGEYSFCPQDADLSDPTRLITLTEVYAAMAACGAQRKLLLIDACRENVWEDPTVKASQANGDGIRSIGRFTSLANSNLPEPPNHTAAFLSCLPGEVAYERHDDGITHGVFFSAVIRGLQGSAASGSGQVTLQDLERFVKKDVESYVSMTYSAFQHPVMRNNTSGVFPIVSYSASEVQIARAHALILRGQDESAAAIIDQLLIENPDDAYALATRAKIVAQSGESANDQTQLDLALELSSKAVEIAPAKSEVQLVVATVRRIRGEVEEAKSAADLAIQLDPNNCLALVERSAIKCMQNDLDGSLRDIESALAIDERDPLARSIHAAVLFAADRSSEAFASLERGLSHSPDVPALYFMKGYMLDQQGDYDKAIMAYTGAWRLNRRDVDVLCRRAVSLANAGDFPAAYDDLSDAQRLYPNNPEVSSARIVVLCGEKKYQLAIEELNHLIKRQPDFAEWYQIRSALLQRLGRQAEPRRDREKFESLSNPEK